MNNTSKIAVGIDVCKSSLDVYHSGSDAYQQFRNSPRGNASLLAWLKPQSGVDIIVLEATGGYEIACWKCLCAAGYPTARVNPKRPRDFARATGILAKTDRVDACVLASFGICLDNQPAEPKAEEMRDMEAWLIRRGQLMEMRVAESNRLRMANMKIQKRIELHFRQLQREIEGVDEMLAQRIQQIKGSVTIENSYQ